MKQTKKVATTQPLDLNQQLVDAVNHGDMREVCRCLDAGADPNTRGRHNEPLLFELGPWPHESWPIWRELIKAGADVSVRDKHGSTILHWAAGADQVAFMALILDHGMDIEALDQFGNTALQEAVLSGAYDAVKELIEREANLLAKNLKGETPMDLVSYAHSYGFHIEFALEEAIAEREDDEGQDDEEEEVTE
ncbi:ankyrin repeat domain-containing protein [Dyella humi]|uniref:Ankyrin repeat domain-containing protein n=1 Tax=Dyella humi TaxID=1770547 RepID=A0ABW8IKS1_9GAMM